MEIKYFCAAWCGPCKTYKPHFEKYAADNPHKGTFQVVDIDEQAEEAVKYKIRGVPTLVVVDDNGQEINRATGVKLIEKVLEGI